MPRLCGSERVDRVVESLGRLGLPSSADEAVRSRLAPGDDVQHLAYVMDAGDLDGDGLSEVLDVRERGVPQDQLDGWTVYTYTTTIAAYRGRDGKQLWSRSFAEGDFVFAVPARVGAAGKRGVIFLSYADLSAAVAGDGSVTLSAVDGRGTELWARQIPGVWAGACAMVECAGADGWAVVEDELDAVKGPATDLLVGVVTMADPGAAWVEHEHFLLVSGADGAVTDPGAFGVQANGWVAAAAVPDVSRDGLADFAVLTGDYDADTTTATAYSGTGGPALWTSSALPGAWTRAVVAVGDTNGDRTPDLAITDTYHEEKAHLLDGKTGTRRWTKPGRAAAIGDVNRDRKADVALFRYATQGRASVRAEVYDNAGKLRWRASRALPAGSEAGTPIPPPPPPPGETSTNAAATRIETFIGLGGDMNADGVPDVGYSIVVTPEGDKTRRDEGWVDGRTGRVRRDPAPDLVMLSGAVDGRGDDSVVTTLDRGRLTVTTYAGDTGRLLWRSTVAVAAGYRSPYNRVAVRLTSRRCADLLVTVSSESNIQTIAFRGSTGLPLWAVVRDGGNASPKMSKPKVLTHADRNRCG